MTTTNTFAAARTTGKALSARAFFICFRISFNTESDTARFPVDSVFSSVRIAWYLRIMGDL